MTKKKTSKKFDLSRKDIVENIDELISRLESIDTFATAPNDVADEISEIVSEFGNLSDRVQDEV